MPLALDTVVKQLTDSGIIAPGKLENFVPPKADPKDGEELLRELFKKGLLTKFQAQQFVAGKAKALVLGNYMLIDKIGAGGMGQVFKAEHRRMKRVVAIKMLPAAMLKDAAAVARFQREVEAAAKLEHPNIVHANDADEANGVHFLVMQYVEGQDLSALIKKDGPFSVAKAVNYILQAARGLEFAHGEGVIHRDIKPANLLLDKKGVVKILDMGLARLDHPGGDAATQAELTGTGAVMGTVDYMAPEQALNTKHADKRADIYSLGITLFYLIAGKCAYDGETLMEKLMAHQTKSIPSLKDVQASIPDSVQAIFAKMVAKKREDRYQSMTEVIGDLEKCQAGLSSTSPSAAVKTSSSPDTHTSDLTAASRNRLLETIALPESYVDPESKGPPWKNTKVLIGAGAAGFLFLLLGVIVIIRDKDGKEVSRVEVPEGGSLTVETQPSPKDAATPETTAPATPPPAVATTTPAVRWPLAPSKPEDIAWLHNELNAVVTLRSGPDKDLVVAAKDPVPNIPATIVGIQLHREGTAATTDEVLRRIASLVDLESLNGEFQRPGASVTKDGIKHLAALVNLRELFLGRFGPADTDYSFLERLPRLDKLDLSSQPFPNWAKQVGRLSQLRELSLFGMDTSKLADLNTCPQLTTITVRGFPDSLAERRKFATEVAKDLPRVRFVLQFRGTGEEIIEPTAPLPAVAATTPAVRWPLAPSKPEDIKRLLDAHAEVTLRTGATQYKLVKPGDALPAGPATVVGVKLAGGPVPTDDDGLLAIVAVFTDLEELYFERRGHTFTTQGLLKLKSLVELRRLSLHEFKDPAAGGTDLLKSLPHLEFIRLPFGTKVAEEWAAAVATRPSILEIDAYRAGVTDAGVAYLEKMPQLRKLGLADNVQISEAAIERLAAALPNCRIEYSSERDKNVRAIEPRTPPANRPASLTSVATGSAAAPVGPINAGRANSGEEDRAVAEWVIAGGGQAGIFNRGYINKLSDLPAQPYLLTELRLASNQQITPADARRLATLAQFDHLYFNLGEITPQALTELRDCPRLRLVAFDRTKFQPGALEAVLTMKRLVQIELLSCNLPDAFVRRLGELPNLRELRVSGDTVVTDAGLIGLAQSPPPNLAVLDLSGTTKVTAAGLSAIATLPHLRKLRLQDTKTDDQALRALAAAKGLAQINLFETQVTRAGADWLHETLGNCRVHVSALEQAGKLNGPAYQAVIRKLLTRGFGFFGCVGKSPGYLKPDAPWPDGAQITVERATLPETASLDDIRDLAQLLDLQVITDFGGKLPAGSLHELLPLKNLIELPALPGGDVPLASDNVQLLVSFPKLRSVRVCVDGDASIAAIAKMPHLTELWIYPKSKITDACLKSLVGVATLNTLTFNPTSPITRPAIEAFAAARPDVTVTWNNIVIEPPAASRPATATTTTQPTKPWNTPAFQAWVKHVQAMPADEQVKAVSKRLVELNPGFDGAVTDMGGKGSPKIEKGVVTEFGFFTDHVTDISPIRVFGGLKNLKCDGPYRNGLYRGVLSDLSPLQGMPLTYLNCGGTAVSDLSPLTGMPLTILAVGTTKVSDLSPLQKMPLITLRCGGTQISNVSPLESCKSLNKLSVNNTKVAPASVAALQKALPNCKVDWDGEHRPLRPARAPSRRRRSLPLPARSRS